MRELFIALDDIRSHHNVGSIFRSADAFGVKEIILGGISPCPPHRDIQKTALGATESVSWRQEKDLLSALKSMKAEGIKLIAVEQTTHSSALTEFKPKNESYCLVLGNEVNGVSAAILEICDKSIEIKQVGIKKSLNVSVCAGIVMFHWKNGL